MASALFSHEGRFKCNGLHDNYHYLHIVAEQEKAPPVGNADDGSYTVAKDKQREKTKKPTTGDTIRDAIKSKKIKKTTEDCIVVRGRKYRRGDTSYEDILDLEYPVDDGDEDDSDGDSEWEEGVLPKYRAAEKRKTTGLGSKKETLVDNVVPTLYDNVIPQTENDDSDSRNRGELKDQLVRSKILASGNDPQDEDIIDSEYNGTEINIPTAPDPPRDTSPLIIGETSTESAYIDGDGNERFPGSAPAVEAEIDWRNTTTTAIATTPTLAAPAEGEALNWTATTTNAEVVGKGILSGVEWASTGDEQGSLGGGVVRTARVDLEQDSSGNISAKKVLTWSWSANEGGADGGRARDLDDMELRRQRGDSDNGGDDVVVNVALAINRTRQGPTIGNGSDDGGGGRVGRVGGDAVVGGENFSLHLF